MLQRANLCRALIHEPRMLLARRAFRRARQFSGEELCRSCKTLDDHKATVLLVTHDLRERISRGPHLCDERAAGASSTTVRSISAGPHGTMTFEPDFVALNQKLRAFIVDARSAPAEGAAS